MVKVSVVALGLTVPVNAPSAPSASPAGSSPSDTEKLSGAVPPVATMLAA